MRLDLWHTMLQDAMWWEKNIHPDYAIILFQHTARAHIKGCRYYVNDPYGQNIDLTKIYEHCKLINALRTNYE